MESTIQFTNTPRPKRSNSSIGVGGVVPIRTRSRSRSRSRKSELEFSKSREIEDAEDEDAGLRNENDYKRRQVGRTLFPIHNSQLIKHRVSVSCRYSSWPTNPSVQSMATLAPLHSTCIHRPFPPPRIDLTCLVLCL
jgi:hypothetical protein